MHIKKAKHTVPMGDPKERKREAMRSVSSLGDRTRELGPWASTGLESLELVVSTRLAQHVHGKAQICLGERGS